MNSVDEKFEQRRWEFRRREDDGDTSSDDDSKSINPHKKPKLITSLVLYQNEEPTDDAPRQGENDHNKLDANDGTIRPKTARASKKKINPSKKKNKAENKSKKCLVKQDKRKKNPNNAKEVVMFEDLRNFSDSLIHELKVARESMFTHMREEMAKVMLAKSNLRPMIKKNVNQRSQKDKVQQLHGGIKLDPKPQKSRGASKRKNNLNEKVKSDGTHTASKAYIETSHVKHEHQIIDVAETNEPTKSPLILAKDSYKVVVSSPYSNLPSVIPKPQLLPNRRNSIPSNEVPRISISALEIGNLMANGKSYYYPHHELQPQPQQFGSLSKIISCKSTEGALAQNYSSQTTSLTSVRFPVPKLSHVVDSGSDLSSLTNYSDNSFRGTSSKIGFKMNEGVMRYPESLSEGNLSTNNINSSKTDGEFASLMLQDLKESQRYLADFRSNQ